MNTNNSKHQLKRVDLNVAYACNIKCRGCISLSDFKRVGVVSNTEIDAWLAYWSTGLDIDLIALFGGEPLINSELIKICHSIRKYYPTSVIKLITNGYLLDNIDPANWFELGLFEMQISIHRADHELLINKKLKKILEFKKGWNVHTTGLNQHQQIMFTNGNVKIYKSKFKDFVTPYNFDNKQRLIPFTSDPVKAHAICGSPDSPVLYKGALYKCPPVANIIDYVGKNWNNYASCQSLDQLGEFIQQVGRPESVCAQCPERTDQHSYDHFNLENVYVKQKNIS